MGRGRGGVRGVGTRAPRCNRWVFRSRLAFGQSIADSPQSGDDATGRPADLPPLLPACLGGRPPTILSPPRPGPHTLFLQLSSLRPSHWRPSVHTGKPQPSSAPQPESRSPGTAGISACHRPPSAAPPLGSFDKASGQLTHRNCGDVMPPLPTQPLAPAPFIPRAKPLRRPAGARRYPKGLLG